MFSVQQKRAFVKAAKKRVGPGWEILGREIQVALVAREAMNVLVGQDAEQIPTETIRDLWTGLLDVAGLGE